jgi:tetratricopeptide (TPR) repeat protein
VSVRPGILPARRRDRRALGALFTAAVVLLGGAWFARLEPTHAPMPIERDEPAALQAAPATPRGDTRLRSQFDTAVLLLHARQFEPAAAGFARVLELAPRLPEAHVNLGFAQLGQQRPGPARTTFENAVGLNPAQANAYYGLAMAHEGLGDLELALGAMRTYLHLARAENESHLRRARAAIWEWETRLAERRAPVRRSSP